MRQPVTTIDIRRDLVGLLPRLRRFAIALTGDTASADELVQTVCQRAVARSHQWNGEGRLESWVYTLARQLWNEDGRKRRARASAPKGNVTDIREAARSAAGSDTMTDFLKEYRKRYPAYSSAVRERRKPAETDAANAGPKPGQG